MDADAGQALARGHGCLTVASMHMHTCVYATQHTADLIHAPARVKLLDNRFTRRHNHAIASTICLCIFGVHVCVRGRYYP